MPAFVVDFIAVVVIPFIIELLKKLKLPVKTAPFVAIALAAAYVGLAKILGLPSADFTNVLEFLMKTLGISAVGVLGYDVVKLLKK